MSFWENKRVLVTGHTGFKGGWLCLWLKKLGANVYGYALEPNTTPNLYSLIKLDAEITSSFGDVRDLKSLTDYINYSQPDVVFHLAAQPIVRDSYTDPVSTYSTNVMGTVNVLEAIRINGNVRSAVIVTTDKCYDNKEWAWGYRENDTLGGHDPYSSSKACAELVTTSYRQSFFANENATAVASARAGNVIGGGDWAKDRLVPDIMTSFLNNKELVLRNPKATRPWQHVLEPLDGYLVLAQKLYFEKSFVGAWNFGPDYSSIQSVQTVVETVQSLMNMNTRWSLENGAQPHEAQSLSLDCSKARYQLKWVPKWSLSEALKQTVEWYTVVVDHPQNARKITEKQISQYMES
jgi:CDP-glucose 4,6-dehydratase